MQTPILSPKYVTLILFIALSLVSSQAQSSTPDQEEQRFPPFEKFVEKFNKHYQSQTEYLKRQGVYLSNIQFIKASNCTSCGVNYFADWTHEQISGIFSVNLVMRKVKEAETRQKIGAFTSIQKDFTERRLGETVPESFDWRDNMNFTPVKNEGYCGASWAFSTAAFFEQESIKAGIANSTIDLSQSYLIACNFETQGCRAGDIESSIDKVIERKGLPTQTQYPYNPDTGAASTVCTDRNLFSVPNLTRISYYRVYDPEQIKQIIFKKPVIAAVCGIDLSFYMPSSTSAPGRTLHCKPSNRLIDHSVLLIGYTETEWIVKNNWGTAWGVNGYGYISRNPSEDCCIGEQLHSSGAVTANCSVQYCQTCVETYSCYKCETGRWVSHNKTTGVQTCEVCTEANCLECYNYKGTCRLCAEGYGINATTNSSSGSCVPVSILYCNMISGNTCLQCKPGYKASSTKTSCGVYCAVKNCIKCAAGPTGPCTDCKPGFSLTTVEVNGTATQFCALNPCTVENCSLCNSTGQCITCLSSFTLQTNGSCTTNCTAISGCINCAAGSTTCNECMDPKSYNSTSKVCQTLPSTANCKVHKTVNCTTCRAGYTLNSVDKICYQTCDSSTCYSCVKTDISICLVCYSGYYLTNTTINGTTYAGVCVPNPCNITNCSLCGTGGVGCVKCLTSFLTWNATANACQNQCNLTNCRDCMLTGTTVGQCQFCNEGYTIDYYTKLCVQSNITHCLTSYVYASVQYCWLCQSKYYSDYDELNCYIYCSDYWCEDCLMSSLYACTKCYDGYYMYLYNGALTCDWIVPTIKGCDFAAFNQTYCYYCNDYYNKNPTTGLCDLNVKDCPSYCEYCTTNSSYSFDCKCKTGVFEWYDEKCIESPFNDTSCYVVEQSGTTFICYECLDGKIVNYNADGCDPACIIANCSLCEDGYNDYCYFCDQGFFLTSSYTCQKCPFDNCKTCKTTTKCIECMAGYELAPNQRSCVPITCPAGFLFTGYECTCPTGTYFTPLSCEPCNEFKCKSCSATKCYSCDISFYLTPEFKCDSCLPDCKECSNKVSCNACMDGFLYDTNTSQCISPAAQGGSFFVSGTTVISCPVNCLQCDESAKCTKCLPGFSISGGFCVNCQGFCKTCQISSATACTSCEDGYFLSQTDCVKCADTNCEKCTISAGFCERCKEGFFMDNNTCKACLSSNCETCNLYGECTKCSSGYGLIGNHTCQLCAGTCLACTGAALNECVEVCNSSQYEINNTCQNCPQKCLTCLSDVLCSTCVAGYTLRNGACKPVCADGCFICNDVNPDVCIQCLAGYELSIVGICEPSIACNDNQTCIVCPNNWTLINQRCEICDVDGDCLQCAPGSAQTCGLCRDGFFINDTSCLPCDTLCAKCSSLEKCQVCKDGFFIPSGEFYGVCQPCESTCKTCSGVATKCTSCKEGYELSLTNNCLRLEKIEGTVELDMALNSFPESSDSIRDHIIELGGADVENGTRYYVITELKEGSVILSFNFAIPESEDADTTYTKFSTELSNTTKIGGIPLIAVKKLSLYKPPQKQVNPSPTPDPVPVAVEPQSINKLAIILGVAIPGIIIILAVIAFTFRKKIFRNREPGIENFDEDMGKPNNLSNVVIHVRGHLPPIVSVNNGNFAPLRDDSLNITGKNRTYFHANDFTKDQSYSKLDGYNDESRNEIDQTLNNIVAELNEGHKNKLNVIAEGDNPNEFGEDLSEIKGSQRGIMDNDQILGDVNNDFTDDIEFNEAKVRRDTEMMRQSQQVNVLQMRGQDKGHLQIIERQEVEDL